MQHEVDGSHDDARDRFLLAMYSEMWTNINRHILVVWQPLGVVVGGGVLFALAAKKIFSYDVATAIFVILVAWLIAHAIDASTWYDRNIKIITNIERQFLRRSDLREIHFFFGEQPKKDAMEHVKLQAALGLSLGTLALLYHFFARVWPGFFGRHHNLQLQLALPYVVAAVAAVLVWLFYRDMRGKLDKFFRESPGAEVRD